MSPRVFKLPAYNSLLVSFAFILFLCGCRQPNKKLAAQTSYSATIKKQIAEGQRLIDINNDSLKIIIQNLSELRRVSGNDTALVYCDYFQSIFYWHIADEQKAMQWAVQGLADAQKADIAEPRAKIYSLIASIDKVISDYTVAFKMIEGGLKVARQKNDTASVVALLGLKGMFTRGEGVAAKRSGLYDESLKINFAALELSKANIKYEALQARLLNNIGQCYIDKKQYKQAVIYLQDAIDIANKYNRRHALIHAYCRIGQAYYYAGQQQKGMLYMQNGLQLARQLHDSYWQMETNVTIYNSLLFSGNYKLAIQYNNAYKQIADSLKALENVRHVGELELKFEAAQKDKEIAKLAAKSHIEAIQRNATAMILVLLCVIAILVYLKQQKDKKLLEVQKALLDDELQLATRDLKHFTETLRIKNEIIEEFKAQLEQLQLQHINAEDMQNLERLLNAHIMTEENWENFKRLFDKVYTGFFANLKRKVPDNNLTAADIRVLVLAKLQLGNAEMAHLLGITLEGIKKAKQRLRKKIGLEAGETLSAFVDGI